MARLWVLSIEIFHESVSLLATCQIRNICDDQRIFASQQICRLYHPRCGYGLLMCFIISPLTFEDCGEVWLDRLVTSSKNIGLELPGIDERPQRRRLGEEAVQVPQAVFDTFSLIYFVGMPNFSASFNRLSSVACGPMPVQAMWSSGSGR